MTKRLRDGAAILPVIALILFTPPFVQTFDFGAEVFGLPLLLLALTIFWIVGIFLTALVARRLIPDLDLDSESTVNSEPPATPRSIPGGPPSADQ